MESEKKVQTEEVMSVSAASRIPEFWPDEPRVWFIRTEAVLNPLKVGDQTKFDMVVSKLPKMVILQLTDFLAKPPESGKYEELKNKLFAIFGDSKERQIEKMNELELGDQKASQLLRRMQDLGKDKFPSDTIRIMWQRLLPATVRAVLAAAATTELDKLAEIADGVLEATRAGRVSAVTQSGAQTLVETAASALSDTDRIMGEIAKLSGRIKNLEGPRPGGSATQQ